MNRLVIGLVSLIGLTGVAFVAGYLLLFSASTDRAAALAPANTAIYANVYLQPSTGQRMNLAELIGRLPGFADDATLDEKVDQVVQNLLAGTGIDYRDDLKPWLGNQIAVAAWAGDEGVANPDAIVIVDVRDRETAEAAVARLAGQVGDEPTVETYEGVELHVTNSGGSAYAFVGEMLVLGESADGVRAAVDVQQGAPGLDDRTEFDAAMADLPADHLASLFVDLAALAATTDVDEQLSEVSIAGAALVAERDGIRLSGSAPLAADAPEPSGEGQPVAADQPSTLSDWMPDETVAELVVFGLRQTLEDAEAAARATPQGQELGSTLDTFRAIAAFGLGIDVDADVLPLLDGEVGVAVNGLEGEMPAGQLLLRPGDPEAAAASLGRIAEGLGGGGAEVRSETVAGAEVTVLGVPELGEVAYTVVDGTVILALSAEDIGAAIEAHETGESLSADDGYERAFDVAGTRAGNEAYVNVAALLALVPEDDALPSDARDILAQIDAFAFTAPSRADEIEFHAVLTIEDGGPE